MLHSHVEDSSGGTLENTIQYLHRDHLGSVDAISGEMGSETVTYNSYSPFGELRSAATCAQDSSASSDLNRGFTGHEHIDELNLVNMNGRVYDPEQSRFLSADPHVQMPGATQGYNRYAYVQNNPLKYTDPSGYFLDDAFDEIGDFIEENGAQLAAIAVTTLSAGTLSPVAAGFWGGVTGGLIASDGNIHAGLKGGVFGAFSASFAYAVGHGEGGFFDAARKHKAFSHGVAQGALSELRGGRFKDGFLTTYLTHGTADWGSDSSITGQIATKAMIGGVVSVSGGKKFANGASTAAFLYTLKQLPGLYEKFVGYDIDMGSGGPAVRKGPTKRPVEGANNVGTQHETLNPKCILCEGGLVSRVGNKIFGVNATAGVHDVFQISSGVGVVRDIVNVPGMYVAATFTYHAYIGQTLSYINDQQLMSLAVSTSYDDD